MSWLFESQHVLLPSVYLRWSLTSGERVGLVGGRVKEALRIARQMTTGRKKVLPYYWYKYQDRRDTDLTRADLEATLRKITDLGADGFIIWGSSDDINTREKCLQFREYLNTDLGPVVKRIAVSNDAVKSRIDRVSVDQV
ncbi:hyaluronidase-like [Apis florea]|uniref:hyaluronidase-like n=1 Tax=Apis florea TaxID=7463 RepID=UPI000629BF26|nr:hyaluronidase-like [Apis florea]